MARVRARRGTIAPSYSAQITGTGKAAPGLILTVEVRDAEVRSRDLGAIADSVRAQVLLHLGVHAKALNTLQDGQRVSLLPGLHSAVNPEGAALLAGMVGHIAIVEDADPNLDGDILVNVPHFGELRILPQYVRPAT